MPIPPGSMGATLKDGKGRLTFKIEQWKDGKITVISPAFGRTIIDSTALKSVEFNLDKPRTTASVAQPSRTATSSVRIRNRAGVLELNGAFGNAAPQVIEQLQLQIKGNQLPARPLPRKR